jgi:hypothetical protein
MHINFERTGGFAGLRLSITVESHSLEESEASLLAQEVEQSGFFSLPSRIGSEIGEVDRFEYHILIELDNQMHAVDVGESVLPDSLRPLVEHLERLLRTRR